MVWAGTVGGALFDWFDKWSEAVAAFSTMGLVLFAALQIILEVCRRKDARRAASIQARGPAWLARRALEDAIRHASLSHRNPLVWAGEVRRDDALDSLQVNMLESLRLASLAGGDWADIAGSAFNSFLAFTDRINMLATFQLSGRGPGGTLVQTEADAVRLGVLFGEAISHLNSAIQHLAKIAPRQAHEPAVPELSKRVDREVHV